MTISKIPMNKYRDALTHSEICRSAGGGDSDDICICGADAQIQKYRSTLQESDAYLDGLASHGADKSESA